MAQIFIGTEAVDIPPKLDFPEFLTAFGNFLQYRREMRKPLRSARGVAMLLNKLARWGTLIAVEAISESMANGWQGVFPEKVTVAARADRRTAEEKMMDAIREATT